MIDNVARATALIAQRDHIQPGANVAYRLDVYMEMADTLPGIVAEVARLRRIEAAARLVWGTHFSFPGLVCVPGTPLDQLREALGAAGR